jgi:hypothetical protein
MTKMIEIILQRLEIIPSLPSKNISTSKLQIHTQQMYYILSAWSYPLFGCWAREILLYTLL